MIVHRAYASLVLALSLALASTAPGLAQTAAPIAATSAPAPAHVELTAPDGRAIDVSVWQATDERAVIVFSHGHGGGPEAYRRIVDEWVADGFTVVAPLHVDSMAHSQRATFNGPAAFSARVTDLAVVRGFVKATHAGKPLIAAGHSYGSLMSMIAGGAVTAAGPQGDADVKAVVALSSAGDLPGLVKLQTWDGLTTPTLMVTGDADLVPGYATDWTAHRGPFDRSPAGDKMLIVYAGGDHGLVGNADATDFTLMVATSTDFMEAHALGDAEARARLATLVAPDGVTLERR